MPKLASLTLLSISLMLGACNTASSRSAAISKVPRKVAGTFIVRAETPPVFLHKEGPGFVPAIDSKGREINVEFPRNALPVQMGDVIKVELERIRVMYWPDLEAQPDAVDYRVRHGLPKTARMSAEADAFYYRFRRRISQSVTLSVTPQHPREFYTSRW